MADEKEEKPNAGEDAAGFDNEIPSETHSPRMSMRILAKGENSADQMFWIARLVECGAEITSTSPSGIVAQGPISAFEKALDSVMEMENGLPVLKNGTTLRSSEEAEPPIAYIPNKPTFFP